MDRSPQADRMIGESANFLLTQEHIYKLAPLHKPVLIIGERGTGKELGREYFPGFSKTAARELLDYPWPGNIRELKNVVERAVYQSESPDAPIKDIIFDPFESPYRPVSRNFDSSTGQQPGKENAQDRVFPSDKGFKAQVQDYEISLLQNALQQCQSNQRKTARLLDMTYDQLRGMLRKYNLNQ